MGDFAIYHWLVVVAVIAVFAVPVVALVLIVRLFSRRRQAGGQRPGVSPGDKGPW
jgi:hypothetical protein